MAAGQDRTMKEIKAGTDTNSGMLESILQLTQNIQAQIFKLEKRMTTFELDNEEIKSSLLQAPRPTSSSSSCRCSELGQSQASVHSRFDAMDAKVDIIKKQMDATKAESTETNSNIKSVISKVDRSSGQLTTLTTKVDKGLAQMASVDTTVASNAADLRATRDGDAHAKEMLSRCVRYSAFTVANIKQGLPTLKLANNGASSAVAQAKAQTQAQAQAKAQAQAQAQVQAQADTTRQEHVVARFTGVRVHAGWPCDGRPNEIVMSVDQPISVTGFTLYGGCHVPADYSVEGQLRATRSGQVLATSGQVQLHTDGSTVNFPVTFRAAVDVTPGVEYTVRVTIKGAKSWWGVGGQASVRSSAGVTFTFKKSTTQGCVSFVGDGQIPEITFFTKL